MSSILLARTVAGPMRRLSDAALQVSHNIATTQDLPDIEARADEVGQHKVEDHDVEAAAAAFATAAGMSNFEGAAGYFMVFVGGPAGALIGLGLGVWLVTRRGAADG